MRALSRCLAPALFALASVFAFPAGAQAPTEAVREAQRLYQSGRLQPALERVEAHLQAQPKDAQARFLRGVILTEQKKTSEAIQAFVALTEDFPELPEPYNNLAVIYAAQGAYDKAKIALDLAIRINPNYATAHENLGDVHAQLARRAYERAAQLDASNRAAASKAKLAAGMTTPAGSGTLPAPGKAAAPKPATAPAPAK